MHIKANYNSVEQAIVDPSGVAVLGFFYEVNPHFQKCLLLADNKTAFYHMSYFTGVTKCQ